MTEVLALIARPFDDTAEFEIAGPPIAIGTGAIGSELDGFTIIGDAVPVYVSAGGYVSRPSDEPADTVFSDRLTIAFNYVVRAFQGIEVAGESEVGAGVIELANGDGALDYALDYGWDGRRIEIWKGQKAAAFADFTRVFVGTTAGITWDANAVRLRLRDRQAPFFRPIQTLVYSGGGGLDGTEDLAGKYRPQCWGDCPNVPATLIVPASLIYQVHFRRVNAVTEVRDKGVALVLDTTVGTSGDVATYAELASATIAAGKFATCLALGLIRLGASPDGLVTADVEGDAEGGYVNTTGAIIRRLVTQMLGGESFADPADLDTAAFSQMETDQPSVVGYRVGQDAVPAGRVLDELMTAVGGFWFVKLTGEFSLAVLKEPSGAADVTLLPANVGVDDPGIERIGGDDESLLPSWRRSLGYQPVFRVQTPDELAGSVPDSNRGFYGEAFRFATATNEAVRTKHPLARDVRVPGFFALASAAQAEVERQQALYGADRKIYVMSPQDVGDFELQLGWTAGVEGVSRFGFSDPQLFRIVGLDIDAGTGRRIVYLWG